MPNVLSGSSEPVWLGYVLVQAAASSLELISGTVCGCGRSHSFGPIRATATSVHQLPENGRSRFGARSLATLALDRLPLDRASSRSQPCLPCARYVQNTTQRATARERPRGRSRSGLKDVRTTPRVADAAWFSVAIRHASGGLGDVCLYFPPGVAGSPLLPGSAAKWPPIPNILSNFLLGSTCCPLANTKPGSELDNVSLVWLLWTRWC